MGLITKLLGGDDEDKIKEEVESIVDNSFEAKKQELLDSYEYFEREFDVEEHTIEIEYENGDTKKMKSVVLENDRHDYYYKDEDGIRVRTGLKVRDPYGVGYVKAGDEDTEFVSYEVLGREPKVIDTTEKTYRLRSVKTPRKVYKHSHISRNAEAKIGDYETLYANLERID